MRTGWLAASRDAGGTPYTVLALGPFWHLCAEWKHGSSVGQRVCHSTIDVFLRGCPWRMATSSSVPRTSFGRFVQQANLLCHHAHVGRSPPARPLWPASNLAWCSACSTICSMIAASISTTHAHHNTQVAACLCSFHSRRANAEHTGLRTKCHCGSHFFLGQVKSSVCPSQP
jgi:hypothetical protein